MSQKPSDLISTGGLKLPIEEQIAHRQFLALDSLLKLTSQFANKPDFHNLVHTMLLTLAGQFSVPSSFALMRNPSETDGRTFFTATGKFSTNRLLQTLILTPEMSSHFIESPTISILSEIEMPEHCKSHGAILQEAGVELICSLVHADKLLGLVGFGSRVSGKPYKVNDVELMHMLVGNIIPLLASSYFFQEIKDLSAWHIDILNNVRQGVFVFNSDSRLLNANTAGTNMVRRYLRQVDSDADLTGKLIEEIFPEQVFVDWSRRFIKANAECNNGSIENLTVSKDDDERIFEARVSSISGGGHHHANFIATIDDVTERVRADRIVRESRELLVATVESTGDGILVVNGSGRVIYSNSRFAEMWGIPDQLLKNCDEDDKLIEYVLDRLVDPEEFLTLVRKLYASDENSFDTVYLKNDCAFERFSFPLVHNGQTDGRVWNFRDITERLRDEKLRDSLREKLDRAELMESLGVLAGGVAHDLNNMLGPMVGYPDLMLLKLAEDDPMRRHVLKIGESARQAANVVQDLLSLARRGRYEMEPTDMNEVVKSYSDSRSFLKLKEDHSEVDVKIELQEHLGKINGSSSHLQKTVMNLIVNAFDAMPDGGDLIVSTSEKFVSELADGYTNINPGNYVLFHVRDNGMGIESKDLEKIFEPYFSKKTIGTSGTGLGLSVVYGVVKDHGGYYDILSTPGKGTEFILYFPVTQVEDEQCSEKIHHYAGTETVLVVDDLEDQREMISELLVSLGYKTIASANGRDAVEYMRYNTVDLVVLDMIMEPGFDGLDTYKEIIKLHPDIRAIVMSGYSATDRVEEMKKLGVGQYLRKPFTLQEIGTAVRNELDKVMDVRLK